MNEPGVENLLPPIAPGVPRLEQDALAFAELVFLQFRGFHRISVLDFDYTAGTDHRVERDRVERRAILDEMVQTVHVRAGVAAQIHF